MQTFQYKKPSFQQKSEGNFYRATTKYQNNRNGNIQNSIEQKGGLFDKEILTLYSLINNLMKTMTYSLPMLNIHFHSPYGLKARCS